jgi:antitoxin YefM
MGRTPYRNLYKGGASAISYSRLRAGLKAAMDKVCADHSPLVVERTEGGDVVLISREDCEALEETAYLLRSPANARRLLAAAARGRRQRNLSIGEAAAR